MTKVYGSTDSANNAIGYITQGVGFPLIVIDDSPPPAELLIDAPDPIINPYTGTVANLNLGWNENGLTGTGLTIQYANIGNLGPNYKLIAHGGASTLTREIESGRNVLDFPSDSSISLDMPRLVGGSSWTIINVCRRDTNTVDRTACLNSGLSVNGIFYQGAQDITFSAVNSDRDITIQAESSLEGVPHLCVYRNDNESAYVALHANGQAVVTDTGTTYSAQFEVSSLGVTTQPGFDSEFVGTHYETLIYDDALSDEELADVVEYLTTKWGIATT